MCTSQIYKTSKLLKVNMIYYLLTLYRGKIQLTLKEIVEMLKHNGYIAYLKHISLCG